MRQPNLNTELDILRACIYSAIYLLQQQENPLAEAVIAALQEQLDRVEKAAEKRQ